ncbi:unnamed protein product, partial [Nesidiocoris tenuis]
MITVDYAYRGEKLLKLKAITDQAINRCTSLGHKVESCIVVKHLPRLAASMNCTNGEAAHLEEVAN